MKSIAFPNIFNGSTINCYSDHKAIKSNLKLLLAAHRGGLYGDPHFGTALKEIIYDQAYKNVVIELLKDEIYESIFSYMPQVSIARDDINVTIDGNFVSATIYVRGDSEATSDLLKIDLLTIE